MFETTIDFIKRGMGVIKLSLDAESYNLVATSHSEPGAAPNRQATLYFDYGPRYITDYLCDHVLPTYVMVDRVIQKRIAANKGYPKPEILERWASRRMRPIMYQAVRAWYIETAAQIPNFLEMYRAAYACLGTYIQGYNILQGAINMTDEQARFLTRPENRGFLMCSILFGYEGETNFRPMLWHEEPDWYAEEVILAAEQSQDRRPWYASRRIVNTLKNTPRGIMREFLGPIMSYCYSFEDMRPLPRSYYHWVAMYAMAQRMVWHNVTDEFRRVLFDVILRTSVDQMKRAVQILNMARTGQKIDLRKRKLVLGNIEHLIDTLFEDRSLVLERRQANLLTYARKIEDIEREARERRIAERKAEAERQRNTLVALPPIPLPDIPGLRFMNTGEDFINEGVEMSHCVASYLSNATSGYGYFFHYDTPDGKDSCTIQVDPRGMIYQNHGPHNRDGKAVGQSDKLLKPWLNELAESYNRGEQPVIRTFWNNMPGTHREEHQQVQWNLQPVLVGVDDDDDIPF
jgi:hypothetical protein